MVRDGDEASDGNAILFTFNLILYSNHALNASVTKLGGLVDWASNASLINLTQATLSSPHNNGREWHAFVAANKLFGKSRHRYHQGSPVKRFISVIGVLEWISSCKAMLSLWVKDSKGEFLCTEGIHGYY